jgi:hypothetical protein
MIHIMLVWPCLHRTNFVSLFFILTPGVNQSAPYFTTTIARALLNRPTVSQ